MAPSFSARRLDLSAGRAADWLVAHRKGLNRRHKLVFGNAPALPHRATGGSDDRSLAFDKACSSSIAQCELRYTLLYGKSRARAAPHRRRGAAHSRKECASGPILHCDTAIDTAQCSPNALFSNHLLLPRISRAMTIFMISVDPSICLHIRSWL